MGLHEEFLNHDGRVAEKWAHYFPVYEAHFGRFVGHPVKIFEIGCGEGGSLQFWKRYLGRQAQIIGIDNNPACEAFVEEQIAVRIGGQADAGFLDAVIAEFGAPDIVIDDGSHVMSDVVASFVHLYPLMSPHGVYLVEDLHTAYWPEYGGGLRRAGSFIEFSKNLIDQLNARWSRGAMKPTGFTHETLSMHFHDSIVVFERGPVPGRLLLRVPARTAAPES